ncbi:Cyclin-like F-box [Cordyceps militaris]|uniref:Cyclin-like F-box n=1 Tax=Cordyceps militaris TaxID=73501 RepID=A0A2H4SFS9_CORMI|nr:Cyclin-like F-box [Cordyceps militaris]
MADLASLPNELFDSISAHLSNKDIKNLRLAGRETCIFLEFQRVFLSANPRNIEVFRAVAEHEVYRYRVKEIIWDETLLRTKRDDRPQNDERIKLYHENCDIDGMDSKMPGHAIRQEILKSKLSSAESLIYYDKLCQEQAVVLEKNLDVKAFEYGLERFPNLSRVTMTPAAHGLQFLPLYKTPMIRAFPYGFAYPIPKPWHRCGGITRSSQRWQSEEEEGMTRALRGALGSLAAQDHSVTELVGDVIGLTSDGKNGISFDDNSLDYETFGKVVRKPGFRRLDLAFDIGNLADEKAPGNKRLYKAMADMVDLEHLHFVMTPYRLTSYLRCDGYTQLAGILPVKNWPRLRHFGLTRAAVALDDLLGFIRELPSTLESIELSDLVFKPWRNGYRNLLYGLRDSLEWKNKVGAERITVSISLTMSRVRNNGLERRTDGREVWVDGREVWVDDEANKFLYENGKNPFEEQNDSQWWYPVRGGVERWAFAPEYEQPWVPKRTG